MITSHEIIKEKKYNYTIFIISKYFGIFTVWICIKNISKYFWNAIINEDKNNSNYKIELEFQNPSLLTLAAGETEFFVFYDDDMAGKGNL